MKKTVIRMIFILLSFSLYASGKSEYSAEIVNVFNEGLKAYRQGNFSESLKSFKKGAMLADNNFLIASFYYNAANSSYKMAENAKNFDEKKEFLNAAIEDYRRSLEFYPDFNSAQHNGELALKMLEYVNKQSPEKSAGNQNGSGGQGDGSRLSDIIEKQKKLRENTFNSENANEELAGQQNDLLQKTREYSDVSGKSGSALQKAMEAQKENSELLQKGDKQESLDKQKQIIELLEQADSEQQADSEEYKEYIRKLEKENYRLSPLRQSGGVQDVEKDW